jgi:acetyl-CoA C-acetyltransferase
MSRPEMIFYAARGALDYAGLKRDDLTTVISATNDYYDGKTISNCFTVEAGGAYMKDESKVEMDGAHAVYYGLMRCLSGHHKLALVWGVSQPSTFYYSSVRVLENDPTFDRPINLLNDYTAAALGMRAYMTKFNVSVEDIAHIAVKNHKNAAKNPLACNEAQLPNIEVMDVLNSEMLSDPVTKLMHATLCDGATALILAPEELALKITDDPVWITGAGLCQETYYLGDRDLSVSLSMEKAAHQAYKLAKIVDPKREINLVELFEHSAYEELILAEALGLCDKGKGASLSSEIDGEIPINPSGGAIGAFTPCATGINRIVEVAKQIRGEADGHQVQNVNRAIAHGQIGFCAQNNIVYVLEGGRK